MADQIKIELSREGKRFLGVLASKKLLDLRGGIVNIGNDYREHRQRVFSGREALDPDLAWPPLRRVTSDFKKRRFGNAKIMSGTGVMRRSIIDIHAPFNFTEISEKRGAFGTSIPYAKFHKTGLPNRRVKSNKQRFWLGLNLGLWKRVGDLIPLPKRDPVTPNKSTIEKWPGIVEEEMRRIAKMNNIDMKKK